ncbi:MAG: hypothetical protein ACREYF_17425 [Gammaproteobacteria bacterium]
MPQLIQHIDAIARKKQRDVLFVLFGPPGRDDLLSDYDYDYEADVRRREIIAWLDKHRISWLPCGEYASTSGYSAYDGRIYIDVPYDEPDATYRLVRDYLENPDGTNRYDDARFCYLPLEKAMENAHHDEPGFWERWAEDF